MILILAIGASETANAEEEWIGLFPIALEEVGLLEVAIGFGLRDVVKFDIGDWEKATASTAEGIDPPITIAQSPRTVGSRFKVGREKPVLHEGWDIVERETFGARSIAGHLGHLHVGHGFQASAEFDLIGGAE